MASRAADFVDYLNASPTAFHAVEETKRRLRAAGFVELNEKEAWRLDKEGKYFFSRNGSALVAFGVGGQFEPTTGGAMVLGAHTDSPCLKLKPHSALDKEGYVMLGVVGYGGGLWHTWFDRDLSVAGRVLIRGADGRLAGRLVNVAKPIARISNLAIHLTSAEERAAGFKPSLQARARDAPCDLARALRTRGRPTRRPALPALASALRPYAAGPRDAHPRDGCACGAVGRRRDDERADGSGEWANEERRSAVEETQGRRAKRRHGGG